MWLYNLLNSLCFIFLLSCLSLWACYRMVAKSHGLLEQAKRCAFYNRTDGGLVRFKAYEDAERHREVMRLTACDLLEAISV